MKDPVCGMQVDPAKAAGTSEYQGRDVLLLLDELQGEVRREPWSIREVASVRSRPPRPARGAIDALRGSPGAKRAIVLLGLGFARAHLPHGSGGATARAGRLSEVRHGARTGRLSRPLTKTEWTCPMHPEIVRDGPGACPICGMALEPRAVTLDEENPELDDMTRRFRWSPRR